MTEEVAPEYDVVVMGTGMPLLVSLYRQPGGEANGC
jgi:hypothetical protein